MRKLIYIFITIACVAGAAVNQDGMNVRRTDMGLNLSNPIEDAAAPPMLAFTTVALGGFRGVISNLLWMRAVRLQQEEKYFEMVMLADWITKLQPKFGSVWSMQAWNMGWNISRKYRSFNDRWLWVESAIKLLRDEGLYYNPTDALLYQEIAWIFHDKIGKPVDEAHWHYKQVWSERVESIIGRHPDWAALINPESPEQRGVAERLRRELKMDPAIMQEIDELYGPFDWRLPDAHALYWAHFGLTKVKRNRIVLDRAIWQSLLQSFRQGRVIENYVDRTFELGPHIDIAPKVEQVMLKTIEEQPDEEGYVMKAYRSFLSDAAYFSYTHGRFAEAEAWFDKLRRVYPEALEQGETVDLYSIMQIERDFKKNPARARTIIEGYLVDAFYYAALGEEDLALGRVSFAQRIYNEYHKEFAGEEARMGLGSMNALKQQVLELVLTSHPRFSPGLRLQLRTRLGLPAPQAAPPVAE